MGLHGEAGVVIGALAGTPHTWPGGSASRRNVCSLGSEPTVLTVVVLQGWSLSLQDLPPAHTPHSAPVAGDLLNAGVPLDLHLTSQGWPPEGPTQTQCPCS